MDVTRIPKIELHLHLDGAVPPETMWRMAQEKHVSLPVDTLDEFYAWLVKTAAGRSWSRPFQSGCSPAASRRRSSERRPWPGNRDRPRHWPW